MMRSPGEAPRALTIVAGALLLSVVCGASALRAGPILDPVPHPKFVNSLPIPARIDARAGGDFEMEMKETTQWLGLYGPGNRQLMTTVWGYGMAGHPPVTYPGPTFVTREGVPITVTWENNLPPYNFPNGPGAHLLPVDPNIHLARPVHEGIPTVTHLHGGHTESASDGLPEAWFTQGFAETGPHFVKPKYRYDNDQEAGTLWYHDHALGITRLNVYAGLAGFYLLRDKNEERLVERDVLPGGPYEIEVVVQDRMFTKKGALYYPADNPEVEPGFSRLPRGPSVIAEFFGDFILVNGRAWPYQNVEGRKYRFRLLNGSDSRFYVFELRDDRYGGSAQQFLQIGTDDALLHKAVSLSRLVLAPGERADLVVDFSTYTKGAELYLRNFGPDDPFKGFNPDGTLSDGAGGSLDPANPETTGQIMRFRVATEPLTDRDAKVDAGTPLRPAIEALTQTGAKRGLALFEGLDSYGRLQPMLGTLEEGSKAWFEPITENPMLNDTEVWEVYNATEDAHPIHLHLVAFQIINRESFEGTLADKPQPQHDGSYGVGGVLTVTGLGDDAEGPAPNEAGWKDTAIMPPGKVTRLIAKFDRPGRYVWHCHILSHEDHEMMRPYVVQEPVAARAASRATADPVMRVAPSGGDLELVLERRSNVHVKIFNVLGQLVRDLGVEGFDAGTHRIAWDGLTQAGNRASNGLYFYSVSTGRTVQTAKTIVLR